LEKIYAEQQLVPTRTITYKVDSMPCYAEYYCASAYKENETSLQETRRGDDLFVSKGIWAKAIYTIYWDSNRFAEDIKEVEHDFFQTHQPKDFVNDAYTYEAVSGLQLLEYLYAQGMLQSVADIEEHDTYNRPSAYLVMSKYSLTSKYPRINYSGKYTGISKLRFFTSSYPYVAKPEAISQSLFSLQNSLRVNPNDFNAEAYPFDDSTIVVEVSFADSLNKLLVFYCNQPYTDNIKILCMYLDARQDISSIMQAGTYHSIQLEPSMQEFVVKPLRKIIPTMNKAEANTCVILCEASGIIYTPAQQTNTEEDSED
jgi:hypothetical protein